MQKNKSGLKYLCPQCKTEEIIPFDVIEYFDAIDPERLLVGPPTFKCEKCGYDYMKPENYKAKVIGGGIYEGIDYTIMSKSKHKKRKK